MESTCLEPGIPTAAESLPFTLVVSKQVNDFERYMCAMKCSHLDDYGFDIPLPNCADPKMEDTIGNGTTNATEPADQDKQVAQQVQKTTGQCKRPTPAQRLGTYLQRAKAARLVKEHQAKHPPQENCMMQSKTYQQQCHRKSQAMDPPRQSRMQMSQLIHTAKQPL